jgi:ABC-type branched-subunit amino acid transport system ATPase component
MTEPLLEVENLDAPTNRPKSLFGVSLAVAPGSLLAVLGATEASRRSSVATSARQTPGTSTVA